MKAGDRVVLTALPHAWRDITAKSVRGTLMSEVRLSSGGGVSSDNPTTGATRMTPEGVKVQWDGYEYAPGDYHWVSPEIIHVLEEKPEVKIEVRYAIEMLSGTEWKHVTSRRTEEEARRRADHVSSDRELRVCKVTTVSARKSEVLE